MSRKKNDFLIIIPAYNEEDTIEELVEGAKKFADVCVVNDCSNDLTSDILNNINDINIINHKVNENIPKTILDGMRFAVENNYIYAITIDAGLSHNPNDIPLFIEHDVSDLVIGTRIKKINTPLYRRILSLAGNLAYNIILNFPSRRLNRNYIRDIPSGFRRYSNRAMKLLLSKKIKSRSFDFLFETAYYIYNKNLEISSVPIIYNYSNSSLSWKSVRDCILFCLNAALNPRLFNK